MSLLAVVLQPIWASPFTCTFPISLLHDILTVNLSLLIKIVTINGVTNSAAVESFSFGALSSVDAASGLATGKLSSTATLRRKADSSSPGLYKMLFTNAIADIVIKDGLNDPNGKRMCLANPISQSLNCDLTIHTT